MTHKSLILAIAAALLGAAPALAQDYGQVDIPADSIRFAPAIPDNPKGPHIAQLWGEASKGPHGFMIRIPAGFTSGVHVHTAGYRAVVIRGVILNAHPANKAPTELPVGSYWFQPGNVVHYTACKAGTDCLAYVTFDGPFDAHPKSRP
ncbi:MAG: cupin domain-containing protein [Luteimonas sp.]